MRNTTLTIVKAALENDPDISQDQRRRALTALTTKPQTVEQGEPSPVMTTKEVMKFLKCSRHSVIRLTRDGRLNQLHIRGMVRYLRSEVEGLVGGNNKG